VCIVFAATLNMKNFVTGKAGSLQTGGPAPPLTREQRGAQAKVPSKGAASIHRQRGQQNTSALRQSGDVVSPQAAPQQLPRRQRSGESQGPGHDRYDTDADSLDTTIHGQSLIRVEADQAFEQQQHTQDDTNYSGSEEESDEGFEDEQHGEQQGPRLTYQQLVQQYNIKHMAPEEQVSFLQRLGHGWDEGNSYPSTTSGPPDGFPDNWTIDQNATSEDKDQRSSPSPVGVPAAGATVRPPGQLTVPRARYVPEPQHNMPKQSSIFHQSAGIRQDQRATANLTVRSASQQQTNITTQLSNQPPIYSQALRGPAHPPNAAPQQGPTAQANPSHAHDSRKLPGASRPTPINQPLVHSVESAAAKPKAGEPVIYHEPLDRSPVIEVPIAPIEDYDFPALFDKTYDELKAEDFDNVPRGQPQVLSDDMVQKPLAERLTHVRGCLDASDQDRFFRALRTSEWEEAGDWFLEQFSSIITRTKEVRQKKRKMASEFEDEIEERYRNVTKRQQLVKGSLDQMKTQGESLMPKSPRPSKSPGPRKV
jgi:hypothetical protein